MVPGDTRWFRLKFFLAIFAGPAVNAVMACVVIVLFQGSLSHCDLDALPKAARLFVWANIWVFFVNLWPHKPKTGFGLATDGARLLQLISFRKRSLEEVRAMRFAFEAMLCREQSDFAGARSWCEKGLDLYPEDSHLLNLSGITYLDEENYGEARRVFLKLLDKEKPSSSMRSVLLNNLAYADALSENPAWLAEADAYSKDAYTMLPWMSAVVGTRGNVLVALGHYREGIELLKKSMENGNTPRSKADNACHMAIALTKTGERTEALKYLELAKRLDPKCPLVARAERIVEGEPSDLVKARV
jgi:tetratricopeptide (TPR) repeat protein